MFRCLLVLMLSASVTSQAFAEPPPAAPRIDPEGIGGAVMLIGASVQRDAVTNHLRFLNHKSFPGPILVVTGAEPDETETLAADAKAALPIEAGAEFVILPLSDTKAIRERLAGDDPPGTLFLDGLGATEVSADLSATISEYVASGGFVVGSPRDAFWASERSPVPDVNVLSADEEASNGPLVTRVVISVPEASCLLIGGRRLLSIGDDPVFVRLPKSKDQPARTVRLDRRSPLADLTALRRSLRERQRLRFEPALGARPFVKHGTLIIIGGGYTPRAAREAFVEAGGGKDGKLVGFPTANADPIPRSVRSGLSLRRMGFGDVTVLAERDLETVSSDEFLSAIDDATAVWFGGGRQWRFVDTYEGTPAADAMHKVLQRGGAIAGSSAGASIQGQYMARGNPLGNRDIMADGYERGLNFLPGVAIDQHFTQRNRGPDMRDLVQTYPALLGIGIDESTAIVVREQLATAVGQHRVFFYHVAEDVVTIDVISAGGVYDMVRREVIQRGSLRAPRPE